MFVRFSREAEIESVRTMPRIIVLGREETASFLAFYGVNTQSIIQSFNQSRRIQTNKMEKRIHLAISCEKCQVNSVLRKVEKSYPVSWKGHLVHTRNSTGSCCFSHICIMLHSWWGVGRGPPPTSGPLPHFRTCFQTFTLGLNTPSFAWGRIKKNSHKWAQKSCFSLSEENFLKKYVQVGVGVLGKVFHSTPPDNEPPFGRVLSCVTDSQKPRMRGKGMRALNLHWSLFINKAV